MGIGYFQLTIISENDKYIIGNPQFTYFKAVYKRIVGWSNHNVTAHFEYLNCLVVSGKVGARICFKIFLP